MRVAQRNAANVASLPAPVGGWNARDSLANMEPTDAVRLDNFFPTVASCTLRGGYQNLTTFTGVARTLMAFSGGATTNNRLFAAVSSGSTYKIYRVDSGTAVDQTLPTTISSAVFEYSNFANTADTFLMAVNGIDAPLLYTQSTGAWTNPTINFPASPSGMTATKFANVTVFKNRLWFIEKDSLRAWYLPSLSVQATGTSTAQYIDLSAVVKYGGHLVDLDTWTVDAGYGVDDNLAFVTSNGEVIIYRGTDPASAATWALAGVWKLGSPIGPRCMLKYGGDLLILTYDGLMPMAQSLQSSRLDPRVALSNKIQGAIASATTVYGSHTSTGWQIYYSAKNNAVWINVPVQDDLQEQYVMNTITTSWCRFTGWGAYCWETWQDNPYFGGNGFVAQAWTDTYKDGATKPITTNVLQAFNYFESRGVKKYFTRARPTIFTDASPAIQLGMNVDFSLANSTATLIPPVTPVYGTWDSGLWDNAKWGGDPVVVNNWQGITGLGYCGGLVFSSVSAGTQIEWASTDVVFQSGWAGI
jgi:hypothetical protein